MNEIYHDESLGVHINVVLVRMIMLGYAKVSGRSRFLGTGTRGRDFRLVGEQEMGHFRASVIKAAAETERATRGRF